MDLVARVKGILLTPKTEWAVIDAEPTTVATLYTGYIIPLALIPAVAGFIGMTVLGWNFLGTTIRFSMTAGLERAVLQFATGLAMPFLLAMIVDALAPNFGGEKSQIQALKVSAFSSTAFWVAGVCTILPALTILGLLGLYSLYLLYLGLPVLMKASQDKAMAYTVVVIVCALVVGIVLSIIVNQIVPLPITGLGRLTP